MPFNIGAQELILVLLIVVIVFGVGRLPEIGGALGKSIRDFRSSVKDDSAAKKEETADKGPIS